MEVNIENILSEIKQEIELKGYHEDILSFDEIPIGNDRKINNDKFDINSLKESLSYINSYYEIQINRPLTGNILVKGIKKIIRKLINFQLAPIVERQNYFNAHTVRVLNNITKYIDEQSIGLNKE